MSYLSGSLVALAWRLVMVNIPEWGPPYRQLVKEIVTKAATLMTSAKKR